MLTAAHQRGRVGVLPRATSAAKHILFILLVLSTVMLLSTHSHAQQATLTDDTYFPKAGNNGGQGGGQGGGQASQGELTLRVRGVGVASGAAAAFVKFKLTGGTPTNIGDLPSGTPGSHVAKATLKLFVSGVGGAGSFDVYRVTGPWVEGGGAAPAFDTASPVASGAQVMAAGTFITVDITPLVKQWLDFDPNNPAAGGYPNYGVALVASVTTPNTSIEFDSKEATQTSHQAQLGVVLNHAETADRAANADHATAADSAATVTDGVYVTGSYADPPWITSLAGGKINGPVSEAAHAANADNAATANTANSLAAGAVVPGEQVRGDIAGRAASITGTLAGSQVSGQVAEASHAVNADSATNAVNATTAATANALAGNATVSGSQVSGDLSNATIAGNKVDGAVANAMSAEMADAARGVVSAAQDSDIVSPTAGQLYFNTTSQVFRQYNGTAWRTVDAGLADLLRGAGTLNAPTNPVDWNQLKNVPADVISNTGVLSVGASSPLSTDGDRQNPTLSLSGVVKAANGGTGLDKPGPRGSFLRSDGSVWESVVLTAADLPADSGSYIQNSTAQQANSSFNISGDGTAGGALSANSVNAATQYNIGGSRVVSIAGTNNVFVGVGAGQSHTLGTFNAFFGTSAGQNNSTGGENSFFGYAAGYSHTTGGGNSFFGSNAGRSNITGGGNSFFGRNAGFANTTGVSNAFFGEAAGFSNTAGFSNAFFGVGAGGNNTTASSNSFFGRRAGINTTSGSRNAFFGANAGLSNTFGNDNTFIGASSDGAAAITNATAVGANARVTQSNSLVLGSISGVNGATADTNVGIGTTAPAQRLDVSGNIKISGQGNGLIFPDGTAMFSAALGGLSNETSTGSNTSAEVEVSPPANYAIIPDMSVTGVAPGPTGKTMVIGHVSISALSVCDTFRLRLAVDGALIPRWQHRVRDCAESGSGGEGGPSIVSVSFMAVITLGPGQHTVELKVGSEDGSSRYFLVYTRDMSLLLF